MLSLGDWSEPEPEASFIWFVYKGKIGVWKGGKEAKKKINQLQYEVFKPNPGKVTCLTLTKQQGGKNKKKGRGR